MSIKIETVLISQIEIGQLLAAVYDEDQILGLPVVVADLVLPDVEVVKTSEFFNKQLGAVLSNNIVTSKYCASRLAMGATDVVVNGKTLSGAGSLVFDLLTIGVNGSSSKETSSRSTKYSTKKIIKKSKFNPGMCIRSFFGISKENSANLDGITFHDVLAWSAILVKQYNKKGFLYKKFPVQGASINSCPGLERVLLPTEVDAAISLKNQYIAYLAAKKDNPQLSEVIKSAIKYINIKFKLS